MTIFKKIAKTALSAASVAALAGALLPGAAHAASAQPVTLNVSIDIVANCTLTGQNIVFPEARAGEVKTAIDAPPVDVAINCDGAAGAPMVRLTSPTVDANGRRLLTNGSNPAIPYIIYSTMNNRTNNDTSTGAFYANGIAQVVPNGSLLTSTGATATTLAQGNTIVRLFPRIPASTMMSPVSAALGKYTGSVTVDVIY